MASRLEDRIDITTQILDDIIQGKLVRPYPRKFEPKLKFVIARKWNSWYPSYFSTEGGCYAIITRDSNKNLEKNAGVLVIDPGIKFSENLRKLFNVEPHDIRNVIVSHYHPDHTMGLQELLLLTHEIHYPCTYLLNRTTYDFFKVFQGRFNRIMELGEGQTLKLAGYKAYKARFERKPKLKSRIIEDESIHLKTFKTFHEEVGGRHNSLGFGFDIYSEGSNYNLIMLGDSDGNEGYHETYMNYAKNAHILILHLGSYSNKQFGRGNKHLYKTGLLNIMNCINCINGADIPIREGKIEYCDRKSIELGNPKDWCKFHKQKYFKNLNAVIIDEMGLEMAPVPELLYAFGDFKWLTRLYPLLILCKIFDKNDGYVERLHSDTDNIDIKKCDKIKGLSILVGTRAFMELRTISTSQIKIKSTSEIYNFSLYLALALFKFNSLSINCLLDTFCEINCENYDQIIDSHKFDEDFEIKIKNLSNYTSIIEIENYMYKFLKYFINNIYFYDTMDKGEFKIKSLECISKFSEKIREMLLLYKDNESENKLHNIANFEEFTIFIESIALFGKNETTLEDIYKKYEEGYDFSKVIYLLAYLIDRCCERLSKDLDGFTLCDKTNHEEVMLGILNAYSDSITGNNRIKYFLSDNGIEIDIPKMKIKSAFQSNWLNISESKQEFDKDGHLIFKK